MSITFVLASDIPLDRVVYDLSLDIGFLSCHVALKVCTVYFIIQSVNV